MWKVLILSLTLISSILAAETVEFQINTSGIAFQKDITADTINTFYQMAEAEYKYSNFGLSRDLFTAIIQKTNAHPEAYFFLGKIYEEVPQFKNAEMSKQCYLNAAVNKKLDVATRQQSYLSLIRLTDNTELSIKYAIASGKIATTDESKQAMILAYHKKYEKTGDEDLLSKADNLSRQMNEKFFEQPAVVNTQQVNLRK